MSRIFLNREFNDCSLLKQFRKNQLWGIYVFEYDTVIHRSTFVVASFDEIYNKINWLFFIK